VLAFVLWLGVAPTPWAHAGDADRAAAALAAGDDALAQRAWIVARESYQRALQEDSTLVEAWLGIGHALLGEERQADAIVALRRGLVGLEALAPLAEGRVVRYEQALKRLGELSPEDAELAALARKQSDALFAIGRRYASKDPEAARMALRQALRLAPENRRAAELLERTDGLAPGRAIPLLTGPQKGMWSWMSSPEWAHTEGLLKARVPASAMLIRYDRAWQGDYDVLMEARLVEEFTKDGPAHFALCAGWNDEDDMNVLGYLAGKIVWRDQRGTGEANRTDLYDSPVAYVDKGFDPAAWCSYEVRFRGDSMSAWVNGRQVAKGRRPPQRTTGHLCIKVQNCDVEFRRVDVTPR
jgi:tetratricopeptide (TPR) repeat protein